MIERIWVLLKVFFWNSMRNKFALIFKLIIAVGAILLLALFIIILQLPSSYNIQPIFLSEKWSNYFPLKAKGSTPTQPLSLLSYFSSMIFYNGFVF